ncbi:epoxide hydrolase N-terminal domain-containing protein [Nakamurella sp. A5-74]|uniref:Epoxide hydrolase N-terminal domain-containing protein n=1 Tax=Nakamurella sp. A5-74 TaxID=3158264 RepID=A0AAU8DV32_9ACTN
MSGIRIVDGSGRRVRGPHRSHPRRAPHRSTSGGRVDAVEMGYFDGLIRTWAQTYDWRSVEARIRALPWVHTAGHDVPSAVQPPANQRALDLTLGLSSSNGTKRTRLNEC